jgi:hypothetical protein
MVIRNANASPTTVHFSCFNIRGTQPSGEAGAVTWGPSTATSTDSGSSWSYVANTALSRWEFSDGTFTGFPAQNSNTNTSSSEGVYGARELGVLFTTPAGPDLNVIGLNMACRKTGSPTGNVRFRLYTAAGSLLATSATIPAGNLATTIQGVTLYLSDTVVLDPATQYRIAMGVDAGGDTSNYVGSSGVTFESSAASLALKPMGAQETYLNATWDDATYINNLIPFGLVLDTTGEYTVAAPGGGAGAVLSRVRTGM